jgi:hypothetical protein
MPSVADLIDLRERAKAAQRDAEAAELNRRATEAAVNFGRQRRNVGADKLAQLKRDAQAARKQAGAARSTAQALKDQLELALDQLITGLKTDVPIALLPVRLETRFQRPAPDQPPSELLIRIYPDDIHQDTHELGLTDDEEKWGQHFWRETWRAGLVLENDPTYPERRKQELGAWQQLASRFGPTRAAYIARRLTPVNESARPAPVNTDPEVALAVEPGFDPNLAKRAFSWTRAAQARTLPDRWLVIAYRNGQSAKRQWGELIPAILNTGPNPSFKPPSKPDPAQSIPVDPGIHWMVDFAEAEVKGMGIRMKLTADEAASGFDRLIVLGVKGTLSKPEDGADELHKLIEVHRFTWGCGFVPQATPTNNTETVRSGYSREDVGFQTSFALEREPSQIAAEDGSHGAQAAVALGLDVADLACLRYANGHDQRNAAYFNRVLWPVTIGYFLDQFFNDVLPGYDKEKWRDYFIYLVRACGPLPTLRFGKQPYGLLPVTSLDYWQSDRMELVDFLRGLREVWRESLRGVAYASRDVNEVGKDLVETLGREAVSTNYSWRWARGPEFLDLFWRLPGQQVDPATLDTAKQILETSVIDLLQKIGLSGSQFTRLNKMTFARIAFDWEGPLVDPKEISETRPLTYNYIRALVDPQVSLDDIHNEAANLYPSDQPKPLLYRLLRQAMLLAYAEQVLRSNPNLWPSRMPPSPPRFEPELVDIEYDLNDDRPGDPSKTPTFWRVLTTKPPGSALSLGDQLRSQGLSVPDPLGGYLASLNQLADLPTAALERLLGETLDLSSHRLDAWISSLAVYRLNQFRRTQPTGIYLGGYSWVENVRPRENPSASDGFVHAPSTAQSTTAVVLRSGYLTHQAQPEGARLEIDLSSKRVRRAQRLIEGVRQGQPLGALLGYRFERALHDYDSSLQLNRVIAPLRELAPLTGGQPVPKDPNMPLEAITANNVVDGLKLLERYQKEKDLLDQFSEQEKKAIELALKDIRDAVDAIGDLAIAEGVHQAVQGNYLRAGATLDAISRGETPGEIEVIKTPQSGVAFTQRVTVLFSATLLPNTPWSRNRARAKAEPLLNAWAEQLLGDPSRVRCKVLYFNPGQDPFKDAPDQTADLNLSVLNLCALDIVYAPTITNTAQQTELELRLARRAMQNKPEEINPNARIRLVFARDPSFQNNDLTFPDLFEIARAVRELFTNSRALEARDLARSGTGSETGIVMSELEQRLTDSKSAWQTASQKLCELFDVTQQDALDKLKDEPFNVPQPSAGTKMNLLELNRIVGLPNRIDLVEVVSALDIPALSDLDKLRDALETFSAFAVQSAVPRSVSGDTAEARKELITQAQSIYAQVKDMDQKLFDIKNTSLGNTLEKLVVLFGEGFRVLPAFKLSNSSDFQSATQRRERAQDAEPEKVIPWLQKVTRVRDGARRLTTALTYAEVVSAGDGMAFQVAQFPFDEKDGWNVPKESARTGATSLVIYARANLDPRDVLVGLMIDEWVEVIPNRAMQTALTFHYDAPGACAPQAILLAISPDPSKPWDTDTLEAILNETLDLAKLRAVDYDDLSHFGHFLPALFTANNVGGDPHGDTVSSDFSQ